ncbi:MAG TPA: NAD-dependent epimerase/dehydratase family protein, partial [Chitinophagales bacterium]|nr:NAD-dependent epimerase/dehydratase family protein [Chitinophagales bacterium]
MRIAITGSAGFIGAEMVNYLSSRHDILALQRKAGGGKANVQIRQFDLTNDSTFNAVSDCDVLVHCAFIKSDKKNKLAFKQNVEATVKLAQLCKEKGVHFIFLSTMSAHSEALSNYGKHKFEIENLLPRENVCVLKLGLVIGSTGGLFHSIKGIVSKAAAIPLVDGGTQPIQVIHISDLCKIVETVAQQRITGTYNVGTPQVYRLKDLYAQIALAENKTPKFISIPFWFMKLALGTLELLPIQLPVTTENLLGLKQLKAFDTAGDLKKLGIDL